MNNKTRSLWLNRLANQLNEESHKRHISTEATETKQQNENNFVVLSGEDFRELIQGIDAFRLGSEARKYSGNMRSAIMSSNQSLEEGIPVSIPSNIAFWYLQSLPSYLIKGRVSLGNNTYNPETNKKDIKEYTCGVRVENCTFDSYLELNCIESKYYIKFKNCIFKSNVNISNITINEIEFINCEFSGPFIELSNNKIHNLLFSECRLSIMHLSSDETYFLENITLKNTTVTNCNLNRASFGNLVLQDFQSSEIKFSPNNAFSQPIEPLLHTNFNSIYIKFNKDIPNNFNFKKLKINDLCITGILSGELFFKDIILNKIELKDFINKGVLRFHNVTLQESGIGAITDTQLSKAEFNKVDLSRAKQFQVFLSNLSEITFTNTDFPENIIGRDENDYGEVRETFRQLKYAASKQGDRIKELFYEKFEMNAYSNSLKGLKTLPDRIILCTNKLSNDYGQSWLLALLWFITLSVPLYMTIKCHLNHTFVWGWPKSEDIAQYMNFAVNPLHDFDKVFGVDLVKGESAGKARVYDALAKLVSGYLIFQFLRAFRKYVK